MNIPVLQGVPHGLLRIVSALNCSFRAPGRAFQPKQRATWGSQVVDRTPAVSGRFVEAGYAHTLSTISSTLHLEAPPQVV